MKRSVEEKLAFNKKRGTAFSAGYITGVKVYRNYPQKDRKGKLMVKKGIDEFSRQAKSGDEFAKGIMCGIRDSANERKERERAKKRSSS